MYKYKYNYKYIKSEIITRFSNEMIRERKINEI